MNYKVNKYEVDYDKKGVFKNKCDKCENEVTLLTQKDDSPEYYTIVYVVCDCGEHIEFELPVN